MSCIQRTVKVKEINTMITTNFVLQLQLAL